MYLASFLLSWALSQGPGDILVFLLLHPSVEIQKSDPSEWREGRLLAEHFGLLVSSLLLLYTDSILK